jgi:phosphomannomutase
MNNYMHLSCFKAYDVRGELGVNLNSEIIKRIASAVAQHFNAKKIVIGYDARLTSKKFALLVAEQITSSGSDALLIGLSGTEEMYSAVTNFYACAGIQVTASHNPINYNGLKIVKSLSRPLDDKEDFQVIKKIAEQGMFLRSKHPGKMHDISKKARKIYTRLVISFINVKKLKPFKIVVNSGNGAAGPTFDRIDEKLRQYKVPIQFIRVNHNPDGEFPNGIPNPMLKENHSATARIVREHSADMGIAFDGDFDRCFFFDENGRFLPGEYLVGLLAGIFLDREQGTRIVYEPRVIWNTLDIVSKKRGMAIISQAGHTFIKHQMRKNNAIYGGEVSAHHYFRDFAFCDSGMIPWLLVTELLSKTENSLSSIIDDRFKKFPSSGEQNFLVTNPDNVISLIFQMYKNKADIDTKDGLSVTMQNWRFNLRKSNTEPYLRLNVEGRDQESVKKGVKAISTLIKDN